MAARGGPHRSCGGLWSRAVAALALAAVAAGCGGGAALGAAERGDFAALRAALAEEAKSGISAGRARAVARAVLRGEIERAKGPDGAELVASFSPCARPVDDDL